MIYKLKNELYPNPTEELGKWKGYARRKKKPVSIVIHSTNGQGDSRFENEANFLYTAQNVGADFLIGAKDIVRFLDSDQFYAWHAGNVNDVRFANENSIGIEVHFSPNDSAPIDQHKIANLTFLVKDLIDLYTIPIENISMHRWIAVPQGRKTDPSFFTDEQFLLWRENLYMDELEFFTTYNTAQIYTAPNLAAEKATHINDGFIVAGVLPFGFMFRGKQINSLWAWMENGWGFVQLKDLQETTYVLSSRNTHYTRLLEILAQRCKHLSLENQERIALAYTVFGRLTGIGNMYPFAQAIHETGWFTSDKWINNNNPAGLGATNDGAIGYIADTLEDGILRQYAHLLCYATKENETILEDIARLSPRRVQMQNTYGRGSAITWQDLNGKWAYPGTNYAQKIEEIVKALFNV